MKLLKHPNVIDIYQFFEDDPQRYYVSIEYMRGGEFLDRMAKKVRPKRGGLFSAHVCGAVSCFVFLIVLLVLPREANYRKGGHPQDVVVT